VGQYRPNIFRENSVKQKKGGKTQTKPIDQWKLPLLWKSAKSTDSHRSLEKPSAFPQFPQALLGYFSLILIQTGQAKIHLKGDHFLS
jgi:hypothetical protein